MTRRVLTAIAGVTALITLSASANAQTTPTTVSYSYSGLPLYIAPDNANIITVANIIVPVALTISKVTARVQIQYPNSGDLQVYMYSPYGTRTILLQNDCSVANIDTTFDDAAPSTWKSFCPVEAGRGPFQADQPLSNFNKDDNSFGTWYLAVQNTASNSRSGFITNFTVNITGTLVNGPVIRTATLVNAASLSTPGVVAPGEMISIFGLGVGPTIPVSAGVGALPATLGGTTVTFDGTAAPIAYASLYRVDLQVPYTLNPGATTNVQLTSNSVNSAVVPIPVQTTAPGLWTNSVIGTGPAQVANQNGTVNSKTFAGPQRKCRRGLCERFGTGNTGIKRWSRAPAQYSFSHHK